MLENFNTSNVTVQRIRMRRKGRLLNNFNTSNVTVQQSSNAKFTSSLSFQYI